jgi:hypothetical protein
VKFLIWLTLVTMTAGGLLASLPVTGWRVGYILGALIVLKWANCALILGDNAHPNGLLH